MRILAMLLFVTAACVTGPHDGSEYDLDWNDNFSPHIPVGGFVRDPGTTVQIQALSQGNRWDELGNIKADEKPTFAAGAFCKNSPTLYRFYDPDFSSFAAFLNPYWRFVSKGRFEMTIRATSLDGPNAGIGLLFADSDSATSCIVEQAGRGDCDFYNVAAECGFTLTDATIFLNE